MKDFLKTPNGLFDPLVCRKNKWIITNIKTTKGSKKWKTKNRFSVALSTENPPQIQYTNVVPKYGTADKRFVITVAPQNDIWPQGKTYPKKAEAIVKKKIITPMFQVSLRRNDS